MGLRTPNPVTLSLAAGASGSVPITIPRRWGTAHIKNVGPGTVYFAFDAVPAVAPANGQGTLAAGEAYNADNLSVSTIGFYAVAAARVEVIFYEASQSLFT